MFSYHVNPVNPVRSFYLFDVFHPCQSVKIRVHLCQKVFFLEESL